MLTKICKKCNLEKNIIDFKQLGFNMKKEPFFQSLCKKCSNEKFYFDYKSKAWYKLSILKALCKQKGIKFELTKEDYFDLLNKDKCDYCDYILNKDNFILSIKDFKLGFTKENTIASCKFCKDTRNKNIPYEIYKNIAKEVRLNYFGDK